ncbi:protein-L-isoaspartate O-methyltransferase [Variovorax sp. dw_954]|uniref:protein-L-isoaspartate O-methyltransferase family protein n=1 Tax=Variovorax sp. dw_954 TaxID=2720078 RepID=UPI001BD28AAF|nr:protein-L-isoaspartate O-methyltransferase [Variovorax sp. dw_954]
MNPHANPTLENLRFNMIEQQIRPWDVHDPAVLALLNEIHREDYTPEAHRTLSFFDMELPLGDGSVPGEIMLAPKIEARTLNDLKVQKHETVLEIGTGSGFMAALLANCAASVLTLEINPKIAATAAETLRRNGVSNAEVRVADGSKPLPSGPTFDVIVLSGSVAKIPQNLLGSLKIGGRLAAIVGEEPMMRMHFVTRTGEGQWSTAQPWDTVAPRLLNFPEPSRFAF